MKDEIRKVIEKHLPAEVGTALKDQLQELETLKSEKKEDRKTIQDQSSRIAKLEADNSKFRSMDKWNLDLKAKETELNTKERELELASLRKDLECERRINNDINGFIHNIFRNIQVRKHITGMTGPHSISHNETIDKE